LIFFHFCIITQFPQAKAKREAEEKAIKAEQRRLQNEARREQNMMEEEMRREALARQLEEDKLKSEQIRTVSTPSYLQHKSGSKCPCV
jgi:hypothetical protein